MTFGSIRVDADDSNFSRQLLTLDETYRTFALIKIFVEQATLLQFFSGIAGRDIFRSHAIRDAMRSAI